MAVAGERIFIFGALVAATLLFACGPLLGLDDLRERLATAPTANDGGDGASPPASSCVSNAQCMDEAAGAPALCVTSNDADGGTGPSRKCVTLRSDICLPEILPRKDVLRNDNVALFAAFFPIRGSAPLAFPNALATALAIKELDRAGGIPGDRRHDVAFMFCGTESDIVEQGVKHVVDDLHVPGMIAGFSEADLARFVQDYSVRQKVFTLNPNVTAETLKYRDTDRLVWNLLGTPEDVALSYRPLLTRTETYIHRLSRPDPIRVALVSTDTGIELSIDTVVRLGPIDRLSESKNNIIDKAVTFNGGTCAANAAAAPTPLFKRIFISPAVELGGKPNFTAIADEIADFRPDVIIAITVSELRDILPLVEAKIQTLINQAGSGDDAGSPSEKIHPPIWLLAPRNARMAGEHLSKVSPIEAEALRRRLLGVQYAGAEDDTQRKAWLDRMETEFPKVPQEDYAASENFYDAVYWLAYGLAAAGPGAPVSGESVRSGVRRLLSGPIIHPGGVATVADAFRLITLGETSFEGALGAPNIDEQFGTWRSVGGVFCYGPDLAPRYDVLRYVPATGELKGTFDCFSSF